MNARRRPSVAVIGSLNVDLIATVPVLPRPGETVAAHRITKLFGGKGANQAIAARRQDVEVRLLGCVGDDADGRAYRQRLRTEGIDVSGLGTARDSLTGTAIIGVEDSAENLIIVAPAANGQLTPQWIHRHRRKIQTADALLLQFEVPTDAIVAALRIAHAAGVRSILNPSPFRADFPWSEVELDAVIVNESEATALTSLKPGTLRRQAKRWGAALKEKNIARLIVTRGSNSTLTRSADGDFEEIPTCPVRPVDTVGAGDAFAGCYAAGIARRSPAARTIALANCAGAIATLRPGAQEAIPTQREIRRFQRNAR